MILGAPSYLPRVLILVILGVWIMDLKRDV